MAFTRELRTRLTTIIGDRPLVDQLELSSFGSSSWQGPVASAGLLPAGSFLYETRLVASGVGSQPTIYYWNGTAWVPASPVLSVAGKYGDITLDESDITDLSNDLTSLDNRITTVEDTYVKAEWYAQIASGTSGIISPPTGGIFVMDNWSQGVDALASKLDGSAFPTYESPVDGSGNFITATLDLAGNWTLSGVPTSYPVGIIYAYKVKFKDFNSNYVLGGIVIEPSISNVGVGGVGLFKQRVSSNFEFRNINSGSNKISVTLDNPNNEVDIDINESNLSLNNISGVLSVSKGGTGQDFSGSTGVVKDAAGVMSVSTIVNADISASAAIDLSKLAALTANRALVSGSSGVISASSVTATELGYLSGATSNIQTQIGLLAYRNLSNLASVSINTHLTPDTTLSYNLGDSTHYWLTLYTENIFMNGGLNLQNFAKTRTIGIAPSVSISSSYSLWLPPSQGAANSTLFNDGSGNLSWQTVLTTSLTSAHILVGNGSNVATDVAMSGQATIDNAGAVTLDNNSVIGKVLTGYASTTGTITATDSILTAIEKLNGNMASTVPAGTVGSVTFYGSTTALSQDNANFFWDDSNNYLGLGINSSLPARLSIKESTIGNTIVHYQSLSGGSFGNPKYYVKQYQTTSTDNANHNLASIATASNTVYLIEARVIGVRTGGAAGTAGDNCMFIRTARCSNRAGVLQIQGVQASYTNKDQASWNCDIQSSGTNILVIINGNTNNNIEWHGTIILQEITYV